MARVHFRSPKGSPGLTQLRRKSFQLGQPESGKHGLVWVAWAGMGCMGWYGLHELARVAWAGVGDMG